VAMAEAGRDTTRPDTTQLFHTDRGRVEYGGGGIRPDVFVVPDTFTMSERAFLKALGPKVTTYRDVLSSYALALKGEGRLGSPTFPVTDDMVSEVFRRLRARGVTLADSTAAGGRGLVAQELGYEGVQYAFGRAAESRRRLADDRELQEALTLLRRAKSPQDLLASAPVSPSTPTHN
jgi:hypothetical protein